LALRERSIRLKIVNIVATANLGQPVDLLRLANVEGFLYDQAIYHCAYLKDDKTHAKVSIFATGKMICVGTRSFKDADRDLNYAAKRLAKLGLISRVKIAVTVQNIVATSDIGHDVDLESLATKLPHVIYDPQQFPGAIYYAEELDGSSILVFANGKVVIAGLRHRALLDIAMRVITYLAETV
jgi:transcription initiation factor TFIID TATA-box-binding protein